MSLSCQLGRAGQRIETFEEFRTLLVGLGGAEQQNTWCLFCDESIATHFIKLTAPVIVQTNGQAPKEWSEIPVMFDTMHHENDFVMSYRWSEVSEISWSGKDTIKSSVSTGFLKHSGLRNTAKDVGKSRVRIWVDSLQHLGNPQLVQRTVRLMGNLYATHNCIMTYYENAPLDECIRSATRCWMWQESCIRESEVRYLTNAHKFVHLYIKREIRPSYQSLRVIDNLPRAALISRSIALSHAWRLTFGALAAIFVFFFVFSWGLQVPSCLEQNRKHSTYTFEQSVLGIGCPDKISLSDKPHSDDSPSGGEIALVSPLLIVPTFFYLRWLFPVMYILPKKLFDVAGDPTQGGLAWTVIKMSLRGLALVLFCAVIMTFPYVLVIKTMAMVINGKLPSEITGAGRDDDLSVSDRAVVWPFLGLALCIWSWWTVWLAKQTLDRRKSEIDGARMRCLATDVEAAYAYGADAQLDATWLSKLNFEDIDFEAWKEPLTSDAQADAQVEAMLHNLSNENVTCRSDVIAASMAAKHPELDVTSSEATRQLLEDIVVKKLGTWRLNAQGTHPEPLRLKLLSASHDSLSVLNNPLDLARHAPAKGTALKLQVQQSGFAIIDGPNTRAVEFESIEFRTKCGQGQRMPVLPEDSTNERILMQGDAGSCKAGDCVMCTGGDVVICTTDGFLLACETEKRYEGIVCGTRFQVKARAWSSGDPEAPCREDRLDSFVQTDLVGVCKLEAMMFLPVGCVMQFSVGAGNTLQIPSLLQEAQLGHKMQTTCEDVWRVSEGNCVWVLAQRWAEHPCLVGTHELEAVVLRSCFDQPSSWELDKGAFTRWLARGAAGELEFGGGEWLPQLPWCTSQPQSDSRPGEQITLSFVVRDLKVAVNASHVVLDYVSGRPAPLVDPVQHDQHDVTATGPGPVPAADWASLAPWRAGYTSIQGDLQPLS
eukprot:506977-Rhodomonas_salina.1